MYNSSAHITVIAGESIPSNVRVKLKTGTTTNPPEVVIAGDTDQFIGFSHPVPIGPNWVQGKAMGVNLKIPGIHEAVAAKAIAVGANLYVAADGKLSDAGTVLADAVAFTSAAADGDLFSFIYT